MLPVLASVCSHSYRGAQWPWHPSELHITDTVTAGLTWMCSHVLCTAGALTAPHNACISPDVVLQHRGMAALAAAGGQIRKGNGKGGGEQKSKAVSNKEALYFSFVFEDWCTNNVYQLTCMASTRKNWLFWKQMQRFTLGQRDFKAVKQLALKNGFVFFSKQH